MVPVSWRMDLIRLPCRPIIAPNRSRGHSRRSVTIAGGSGGNGDSSGMIGEAVLSVGICTYSVTGG